MAKTAACVFHAPLTGFDHAKDAELHRPPGTDDSVDGLFSFVVMSHLAHLFPGASRQFWAERLGKSKSYITTMSKGPTLDFIRMLDAQVAAEYAKNDSKTRQRLAPQVLGFRLEPTLRGDLEVDGVQRFLRYDGWPGSREVTGVLLRAEVAIEACRLAGPDERGDRLEILEDLFAVASGPFGGSASAMHAAAELGVMVPHQFLPMLHRHIVESPVSFRLLRVLDLFITSWEGSQRRDERAIGYVEGTLRELLRGMSGVPRYRSNRFVDPYPGAEWSVAIAGERLRKFNEEGNPIASMWLEKIVADRSASVRQRLFAAWSLLRYGRWTDADYRRYLESEDDWLVRQWRVLVGAGIHDPARASSAAVGDVMAAAFDDLPERVETLGGEAQISTQILTAWTSVVVAALVTPDGRSRRRLIESIPAAGLTQRTVKALVALYDQAKSDGIRESIVFFLSRLREPSVELLDLLGDLGADEATGPRQSALSQTALWAIGDLYRPRDLDDEAARHRWQGLLEVLASQAQVNLRRQSPHRLERRLAAVHALSVIAIRSSLESGSDSVGATAALRELINAHRQDASEADDHDDDGLGQADETIVTALAQWGVDRATDAISGIRVRS